jgi:hypothetical protein
LDRLIWKEVGGQFYRVAGVNLTNRVRDILFRKTYETPQLLLRTVFDKFVWNSNTRDRGVVHEHITGTVVPRDEAITFLIVEPLYFSSQGCYLPY